MFTPKHLRMISFPRYSICDSCNMWTYQESEHPAQSSPELRMVRFPEIDLGTFVYPKCTQRCKAYSKAEHMMFITIDFGKSGQWKHLEMTMHLCCVVDLSDQCVQWS